MTDKVQKIREEVQRLQNELIQEKKKGLGSDVDDACILELQNVLTYIDSMQEEPVSEDLEEEITKCYKSRIDLMMTRKQFGEIIHRFTEWQKEQMRGEEPVSEELKEAAKHYLYSNILYDDVYVGNPTDKDCIEMFKAGAEWQKAQEYTCYEEAFEDGAKWKKEKTIDKACKWIDENAAKYLVDRFVDSMRITGIDTSITDDFRKDMED